MRLWAKPLLGKHINIFAYYLCTLPRSISHKIFESIILQIAIGIDEMAYVKEKIDGNIENILL